EGINVYTQTPRVQNVRKWIFEMLLAQCPASQEIRDMAEKHGVTSTRFTIENPKEDCMVCGLCTRACEEIVGLAAISVIDRGVHKKIGAPFSRPSEVCVACGCCVTICPTGAMRRFIEDIRETPKVHLTPLAI
ncbi:ferredoxin, partial [Desulfobacterales bacterium HSG17]|nr:ferredoxin [Desulfobacterales bacterium HSG17]